MAKKQTPQSMRRPVRVIALLFIVAVVALLLAAGYLPLKSQDPEITEPIETTSDLDQASQNLDANLDAELDSELEDLDRELSEF